MKKDNRSRSRADKAAPKTRYKSNVLNLPKNLLMVATNLDKLMQSQELDAVVQYSGHRTDCWFEYEGVSMHCWCDGTPELTLEVASYSYSLSVPLSNDKTWAKQLIYFADGAAEVVKARASMTRWEKLKAFFKR